MASSLDSGSQPTLASSQISARGNFRRREERCIEYGDCELRDFHNPWKFHDFFAGNKLFIIEWFQRKKLMHSDVMCSNCGRRCKLCKRNKNVDGYSFRCEGGQHETSVRKDSIFANFRFSIADVTLFILNLLDGMTLRDNSRKIGVNYKQAAPRWARIVRYVMAERVWQEYFQTGGNAYQLSQLVECDESKFGRKVKANSGCPRGRCVWLMGLVEKQTGRLLLLPVKNR